MTGSNTLDADIDALFLMFLRCDETELNSHKQFFLSNVAVRCRSGEARLQCLHSLHLPLTELERDKRSMRNLWLIPRNTVEELRSFFSLKFTAMIIA